MKKRSLSLFCFFLLLLFVSCSKEPPSETSTFEEIKTEQTSEEKSISSEPPVSQEQTAPQSSLLPEEHTHSWKVLSLSESTCNSQGRRVWSCDCGQVKEEILSLASHDFGPSSCTEAAPCRYCGLEGTPLGHKFYDNRCERCKKIITEPIYVLGKPLEYDQSFDSVIATLGRPTETVVEGDLISLVYASDLTRLTVVQLDSYGLWGVFTFDPEAFFQIDGNVVTKATFSGKDDPESDAFYQDFSSCRVYGFYNLFAKSEPYAMWMRYSECDYHYMLDPRISQDLSAQARISYYYVNALRAMHQKSPFLWCEKASDAARSYSQTMANENFFYHDGNYGARLAENGVLWRGCGENISQGYTSAYFVCDAYYNCIDHRNNILSDSFQSFGAAFAVKSDAEGPLSVIGTQMFYY